jgi:hypothetical protein
VMRQALTRRKRQKAQRARELWGVNVEVLFRRDFARLAERWELQRLADAVDAEAA